MIKEAPPGTTRASGFEPPKYLANLIAAINDGAKAAQAGMLVFLLVGLYLLATAFSASDEDILLGKTVTISQIGASLPVSFSFAIAPLVFVFLHVYALTRYDMLATNLRYFLRELRTTVPLETDRERCRQLLANVEFVQGLTAPPGSSLRSRVWPLLALATMAAFPVIVLLLVQINSLRYQSDLINWVQRAWLLIDILAIVSFFIRNPLNGRAFGRETLRGFASHWAALLWMPPAIMWLNLAWLNVVPASADANIVRFDPRRWNSVIAGKTPNGDEGLPPTWSEAIGQPLDVVLCPLLKWGCRYLRVDHRTLVDHVWDARAMSAMGTEASEYQGTPAGIDGVVLRERNLRFAVLDESRLYAADLTGADLSKASLEEARLPSAKLGSTVLDGASLIGAQLQGAQLDDARLRGASLVGARLQGASLDDARLQGASLVRARLQSASLDDAELQGASLIGARLQGAWLSAARLQGASLNGAQLQGARLDDALLEGTSLDHAQLQGASLDSAQLEGASLDHAQLQGASLVEASLQGASLDGALVWRANYSVPAGSDAANFALQGIITGAQRPCEPGEATGANGFCDWSKPYFEAWKRDIGSAMPEGSKRDSALRRIDATLNPDPARDSDSTIANAWLGPRDRNPPTAQFEDARAVVLRRVGCDPDGAPFVVAALATRLAIDFHKDSPYPAQLAAAFLDDKICPGAVGSSAETRTKLMELKRSAAAVAAPR
jgi:uncharacterized protein YjbI with pentapeptide repeats